ncbi:hypothetical protein UCDDS831_g05421 [Diplodia seriata]|uniref:Uncharacterized protein n=1 Tax=Diplodia seriata TaxID=420778 RepID=A0A0G2EAX8_9PEZI|nr:hypothetical protein UCDDS831_g05421 [Diplodia seriata]
MATVRDPMFWKRFSAAIRLDEEEKVGMENGDPSSPDSKKSSRPKPGHSPESWLERERLKKRRRNYICWGFWFGFLGFVAGCVVVIVWCDNAGIFHRINEMGAPQQQDGDGS